MRCAIWYQLYNLKNVKNTHGGVKKAWLKARNKLKACNVTKSNTLPWVFFTFQIVQIIPNCAKHHIYK